MPKSKNRGKGSTYIQAIKVHPEDENGRVIEQVKLPATYTKAGVLMRAASTRSVRQKMIFVKKYR